MSYATSKLRNICLLGHGSNGKTSLVESMLYCAGVTDRLGRVADGNTVSDYDPEETRRKFSIGTSTMHLEHNKFRINILDAPGYFDFVGEVYQALRVADAGIIVVAAKDGVNVGAEKAWKYLSARNLPRAFYISKLDEDHADFDGTLSALREQFGPSVCPLTMPVTQGEKVVGIVDVVTKKAYQVDGRKHKEIPLPADMSDKVEEFYNILAECVAETSEEFMEKYFGGEEFTSDEIYSALSAGIAECDIFPVFCGSAFMGLGTPTLLDAITKFFPVPMEDGKPLDENGPAAAIVYKTVSDQYGKFSFFKVVSGKVTSDMVLINPRTGSTEKLSHIYKMQGKKNVEVNEIACGDIGAVSKLSVTKTGDTLCDSKLNKALPGIDFDEPCYSMAIAPKVKGQEDKIAAGISRLSEEDLTFTFVNNPETRQMVISGAGDMHLDVICSKLKNKFGVDVVLSPARVPYREKICKKVKVQGKHKKQSGGHGQYGDVWVEFEPQDETEDLIFEEKIFGGSVPRNFHPAVEKGLRDSIQKGVLAGYPVVYLKATLVDGSYHEVDSSEMAFKTAASLAYKAGLPQASPVILEPIGHLKVMVPDTYLGDIMSDLSKRRGSPLGMSVADGMQVVEAEVPMAEMSSYAIDLRSMTQGRGSFTFTFSRYEEAPANIQQKIIKEAKALSEGE
ncbi:MAG TPA: elongation factor G [Clostridiales bacterium]|nr:elongation factor G [Clostridiales bacterium]